MNWQELLPFMLAEFYSLVFYVVLCVTVLVSVGLSFLLLVLYQGKVRALTGAAGAGAAPTSGGGAAQLRLGAPPAPIFNVRGLGYRPEVSAEARELSRYARLARYTAAGVYALAGLAHVYTALLVLLHLKGSRPGGGFAVLAAALLLWPVGLTVGLVLVTSLRQRLLTGAAYALTVAAAWQLSGLGTPRVFFDESLSTVGLLMMVFVPATIMSLTMNRWLKATGVLVLVFMALLASGFLAAVWFARALGFGPALAAVMFVYIMAGAAGLAWLNLRRTVRRYAAKRASAQTMILDTYWLLQTEVFVVGFAAGFGWGGLLAGAAFFGYLLVVGVGFEARRLLLRRRRAAAPLRGLLGERDEGGLRLLLLRSFTSGKRGRARRLLGLLGINAPAGGSLLEQLEARWRYVGSIQLIAWTDLASETIEPDELYDFVTGRLADRTVRDAADVAGRVAALDLRPDPDGRYRVNEFFCGMDAWQATVDELLGKSDAVLMDLRGYAKGEAERQRGVEIEIGKLVNGLPLDRLVIVTDDSTEMADLRAVVEEQWRQMKPKSRNSAAGAPRVNVLRVGRQSPAEIDLLVTMLFEASWAARRAGGESSSV